METVKRAVEAWNVDDLDAFLAELDADVEWHPAIQPGLEGKATPYRGHDGARQIWRQDRGEAWERLTNRPQELRDLGESVLAIGHMALTRIRDFLTHAEAIEAARLRELHRRLLVCARRDTGGSTSRGGFGHNLGLGLAQKVGLAA